MSVIQTSIGVGLVSGFGIMAVDFIAPSGPFPGIRVNEIIMRDDGSAVYDWEALTDGAFYAWSGQVFNENGTLYCKGGSTFRYKKSPNTRSDKTVDWMVGDDCSGLTANMEFLFTYTSVNGDLADVRYPETGLGQVAEADTQEE